MHQRQSPSQVAPNLAQSQHDLIRNMICSESVGFKTAKFAGYTTRSVRAIPLNIHFFGISKAPQNGSERKRFHLLFWVLFVNTYYKIKFPSAGGNG
jgi:hypothetical protein